MADIAATEHAAQKDYEKEVAIKALADAKVFLGDAQKAQFEMPSGQTRRGPRH